MADGRSARWSSNRRTRLRPRRSRPRGARARGMNGERSSARASIIGLKASTRPPAGACRIRHEPGRSPPPPRQPALGAVEVTTAFWRRLAATWIDSFIVYAIAVFLVAVAAVAGLRIALDPTFLLLAAVYGGTLVARSGQTIGKVLREMSSPPARADHAGLPPVGTHLCAKQPTCSLYHPRVPYRPRPGFERAARQRPV